MQNHLSTCLFLDATGTAMRERLSADPEARILAEMRERALITDGRAEGFTDGRAEGKASLLMDQLSVLFGPLSPTVVERIQHASEAQLTDWARRVLKANSLEEIFGDS